MLSPTSAAVSGIKKGLLTYTSDALKGTVTATADAG